MPTPGFVKISDTLGCQAQSADSFINYPACLTTGITVVADIPTFELFPNPTNEDITIAGRAEIDGQINIEIYDMVGALVYNCSATGLNNGFTKTVNVRQLSAGSYIVKVRNGEGKFAVKTLIKM